MLIPLVLAALLTLAPAKADDATPACPEGQVVSPEGCSDQAWVDDCPPEHMCAAGADDPQAYGDEDCIECSGPSDAGNETISYGPDDCIDCTGAPVGDPSTCMDGAQDGESCLDDVQYLGGPGQVPPASHDDAVDQEADGGAEADRDAGKDAAALTAVVWVALVGALAFALRRK